jgi:hypothetical protein
VSAEPILFPLPLCLLPRLHGFVVATVETKVMILTHSFFDKYRNIIFTYYKFMTNNALANLI